MLKKFLLLAIISLILVATVHAAEDDGGKEKKGIKITYAPMFDFTKKRNLQAKEELEPVTTYINLKDKGIEDASLYSAIAFYKDEYGQVSEEQWVESKFYFDQSGATTVFYPEQPGEYSLEITIQANPDDDDNSFLVKSWNYITV
ncbi:hypothetical protein PPERSA_05208 [Pseudocohnilembus persalinus]|uniref:Uncharacterized protein n=1 Tax=Pseudocohnilembus persalinus TaxID=266149 RepID=A0A0V0R9F3_PSEPJ|nr:hypothetical protein PPERSA_05208 [Pseudocohnilembus persalinus]|eukprot:KRX11099.1 hypothetical protein PPERSA_05208 [Pseudocohnilembus persalinus]